MPLSQRSVALIGQAAAEWGTRSTHRRSAQGRTWRGRTTVEAIGPVGQYLGISERYQQLSTHAETPGGMICCSWLRPFLTPCVKRQASCLDRPTRLVTSPRRVRCCASNLEPSPDSWFRSGPLRQWSIAPLGGSDLPIVDMTTALARELEEHGFPIASNHYRQAFDAFKSQWEASNGQLRSTFENVLVEATRHLWVDRQEWRASIGNAPAKRRSG